MKELLLVCKSISSNHPFVCLSIHLPIYTSIHLYTNPSIHRYTNPSINLSVYTPIHLYSNPLIHLFISLSLSLTHTHTHTHTHNGTPALFACALSVPHSFSQPVSMRDYYISMLTIETDRLTDR